VFCVFNCSRIGASCFSSTLTLCAATLAVVDVAAEAAAGWPLKENEPNCAIVSALHVNPNTLAVLPQPSTLATSLLLVAREPAKSQYGYCTPRLPPRVCC
jgi:hypothetical protein